MTPNKDILILGLRLDQIYTSANASEEARNGISNKGEIDYIHQRDSKHPEFSTDEKKGCAEK